MSGCGEAGCVGVEVEAFTEWWKVSKHWWGDLEREHIRTDKRIAKWR